MSKIVCVLVCVCVFDKDFRESNHCAFSHLLHVYRTHESAKEKNYLFSYKEMNLDKAVDTLTKISLSHIRNFVFLEDIISENEWVVLFF